MSFHVSYLSRDRILTLLHKRVVGWCGGIKQTRKGTPGPREQCDCGGRGGRRQKRGGGVNGNGKDTMEINY